MRSLYVEVEINKEVVALSYIVLDEVAALVYWSVDGVGVVRKHAIEFTESILWYIQSSEAAGLACVRSTEVLFLCQEIMFCSATPTSI